MEVADGAPSDEDEEDGDTFVNSNYFQTRMQLEFGKQKRLFVEIPDVPRLCVVDGAARYGLTTNFVKIRRVSGTYGCTVVFVSWYRVLVPQKCTLKYVWSDFIDCIC